MQMDISQYLDFFLAESTEHLQALNASLLELEQKPDNKDVFNEILRTAHTLKGMSATMGFRHIAELTHEMESALLLIRDSQVPVSSGALDLLFRCLDALQAMIGSAETGGCPPGAGDFDCQPLKKELKELQNLPDPQSIPFPLALEEIDHDYLRHNTDRKTPLSIRTVRVSTERLDSLLDLVGEMVINKTRLERLCSSVNNPEIQEAVEHMGHLTADMQSIVMKVRMVPIEQVFSPFPRMVRDLSRELNKNIQFSIEGKETELDRTAIDEIGEPLVHLIRNAVDHGIESTEERLMAGKPAQGVLSLTARQEGNSVVIEVIDDGRGINLERVWEKAVENGLLEPDASVDESTLLSFVFQSGFSTALQVTDVSGRGMGMDVVKTKVESLNGSIALETRTGQGTTARIKLPLTLAIIRAILVRVADERYAIPLGVVDEIALLTPDRVKSTEKGETMLLHDSVLPLVRLSVLLDVESAAENGDESFAVVVRKGDRRYGLVVDELVDLQDIVIKPLAESLRSIPGLAGSTVLGDGRVSMILAVDSLF